MERLTHERKSGMKTGYWSPNKKQELVDRLAMYEDREEKDRWIPISARLPEDESYILVSFENATMPDIARYEENDEGGTYSIREMMKNHIQAMEYLSMLGCRCRNHTRRNNEDNNIHHYRLHALCCLEFMHCRSKCR